MKDVCDIRSALIGVRRDGEMPIAVRLVFIRSGLEESDLPGFSGVRQSRLKVLVVSVIEP